MARKRNEKHLVVLRIVKRSGIRTEYKVVLNEQELTGTVVQTMVKGKVIWRTIWKSKTLDHYNPEWLARRNNRPVTLGDDHPSMQQAVAYRKAKEAAAAAAPDQQPEIKEAA